MGEVAEMFDVNQSLIRHWEAQFPELKPHRNKKGNRLFRPEDIETMKMIYHLVKERGMTLEGARKVMRCEKGSEKGVARDVELMEHLQKIRSILVEVREDLKSDGEEIYTESEGAKVPAERKESEPLRRQSHPERKEPQEAEDRELFAFYEQSLF